jgi:hypothetical protein
VSVIQLYDGSDRPDSDSLHRRRGAEGPAVPGGAGARTPTAGMAGTGPGPVDRHGWSSTRLVMHMR